ncbi:cdc42 effector protein 5 [Osmerus eperlanus]|uniref:cdc42 effector protein 5 n=1 Tax=Osmerus eperlanus TaxID=29151 RepID=UPI002E14672A
MPLHKTPRGPRLDPTMISAPLGDFRHTMHIGRGGDAFGDTSFLSTHGPSSSSSDTEASAPPPASDPEGPLNHGGGRVDATDGTWNRELQHSDSVSSFDLDLDLGPSILGDVLGVMDGLGLDSEWTTSTNDEEAFTVNRSAASVKVEQLNMEQGSVSVNNELNEKLAGWDGDAERERGEVRIMEGNGIKSKGLKPKVRFSDKREEIIRQASEEEGQGFEFQQNEIPECVSPTVDEHERGSDLISAAEAEATNHKSDLPPSPASSHSSEYEGVTPLDRRRAENCHSETDSDEEEEEEDEAGDSGRGYTFEDEFDDEIGL